MQSTISKPSLPSQETMSNYSPKSPTECKTSSQSFSSPSPNIFFTTTFDPNNALDITPYDFKSSSMGSDQGMRSSSAKKTTPPVSGTGSNKKATPTVAGKGSTRKATPTVGDKRRRYTPPVAQRSFKRASSSSPLSPAFGSVEFLDYHDHLKKEHFNLVREVNAFCQRMIKYGKEDFMKTALAIEEPSLFKMLAMFEDMEKKQEKKKPTPVKVMSAKRLSWTPSKSNLSGVKVAGTDGSPEGSKENPVTID